MLAHFRFQSEILYKPVNLTVNSFANDEIN